MSIRLAVAVVAWVSISGCSNRDRAAGGELDAGAPADGGAARADGGPDASGAPDAGSALDAGPGLDAAGDDAGEMDAGSAADGGHDAGSDAALADAALPDGASCVALPSSGSITVPGSLGTTSAHWNRPDDDSSCPASTLETTESHYVEPLVFCNGSGAAASYRIRMEGTDSDSSLTLYDPFLVVYAGAGIPTDPLMCLAINDDEASGATYDSEVPSVSVAGGAAITVAATSYDYVGSGYESGTFRIVITRL